MNNFTLDNLQSLSQLQQLVNQCGTNAKLFLEQLASNTLMLDELSQYLGIDKNLLEAALPDNQPLDVPLTLDSLYELMACYKLSLSSGISINNLLQLRTLYCHSTFDEWQSVADALMIGVQGGQYENILTTTTNGLRTALVTCLLSTNISFGENKTGSGVETYSKSFTSNDELDSYLLTDTQCSNESITTPMAWAVATLQLYIERCLNSEESEVVGDAKNITFFDEWDKYNKSYSVWAGLTRLLYEPENYIDPSCRQEQTEAYTNLQQLLNGGPLNEETAEDAFLSYLTEFETLANMTTVNGYHDEEEVDLGNTWFIGRTQGTSPHWYWRRADHADLTAASLPAYAWSGWDTIDLPIDPVSTHALPAVYPVFFNNRLHLVWLEGRDKTIKDSNGNEQNETDCVVKIAHLRYDSSWSMPVETTLVTDIGYQKVLPDDFSIYCTVDSVDKKIVLVFIKGDQTVGWYLDNDAHHTTLAKSYLDTLKINHTALINPKDSTHNTIAMPYKREAITKNISLIQDSVKPEYWWMQWGNYKYSLASDFPSELIRMMTWGIEAVFSLKGLRNNQDELNRVLDFNGALGEYYWELFYHVPLLISQRFQQAQSFTLSTTWLNYVFSPGGYPDDMNRYWNTLPLFNDNSWGGEGTSSTDPDIIAVNDPMHYKLSTFMHMISLLLDRGDAAYRLMNRDSLVEAYMWYRQATGILGDEPPIHYDHSWPDPLLDDVTDSDYFPEQNKKLSEYREKLKQRFYNLRHNLTLDGQAMNLPPFSAPANPDDILTMSLAMGNGSSEDLPTVEMGIQRFQPALESARMLVEQLINFSSTLQGITERQDGEAMSQLLQTQGLQLLDVSMDIQDKTLSELDAELQSLQTQRDNVTLRQTYYSDLYDNNISTAEQQALDLSASAAALIIAGGASFIIGGGLDLAPNVYGVAFGGSRWGALANGIGSQLTNTGFALSTTAGVLSETAAWRRRRDEWKLQLDSTTNELLQLDKQQDMLQIRRGAASLQKTYLQTQQRQTTGQLQLLKTKFTSQQLFNWLRSRLSTIFYQFYDVTIAAALRAEKASQWETNNSRRYVRPDAWQSNHIGLLCGEALMLDLANMESAWLMWQKRAIEVTRTVSLVTELDKAITKPNNATGLSDAIKKLLDKTVTSCEWTIFDRRTLKHQLNFNTADQTLDCHINLAALNIAKDYPDTYGLTRRIKNISVSLPALIGPYQDIQAILEYSGDQNANMPSGCQRIAVSHGINDSGLFQLDFSAPHYLPFEGINLLSSDKDNNSELILRFMTSGSILQKNLLNSLSDIVLRINYTIRD